MEFTSLSSLEGMRRLHVVISKIWAQAQLAPLTNLHLLIQLLSGLGYLKRYYSLYVDGFDERLGLPTVNLSEESACLKGEHVQMRGSADLVRCHRCTYQRKLTPELAKEMELLENGTRVECERCNEDTRQLSQGWLRTSVQLSGEQHPNGRAINACFKADEDKPPEVPLVIGTSIAGRSSSSIQQYIKRLATTIRGECYTQNPTIAYMNVTPPPGGCEELFDYFFQGSLEQWSGMMIDRLEMMTVPSMLSMCQEMPPSPPSLRQGFSADSRFFIILATKESISAGKALKKELIRAMKGMEINYYLWLIEWDQMLPIRPAAFGDTVAQTETSGSYLLRASWHLYVVSTSNDLPKGVVGQDMWPPTRRFFDNLLDLGASSNFLWTEHNSLSILLGNRYYDLRPDPLRSLNHYVQRKSAFLCIVLEALPETPQLDSSHVFGILSSLQEVIETKNVDITPMQKLWGSASLNHYDMTILKPREPPLSHRSANPMYRPFGREVKSWPSCNQCKNINIDVAEYDNAMSYRIRFKCTHVRVIDPPCGTKVVRVGQGWYAKITQFIVPPNAQTL